jgi:uncharacterized phage-associated protein
MEGFFYVRSSLIKKQNKIQWEEVIKKQQKEKDLRVHLARVVHTKLL